MREATLPQRIGRAVSRRREALATLIAALPSEWMGIPAWSRWFRRAYWMLGRELTEPERRAKS